MDKLKQYTIAVAWEQYGYATVEAKNLKEAIKKVQADDFPLPEGDYLFKSFEVDREALEETYAEEMDERIRELL